MNYREIYNKTIHGDIEYYCSYLADKNEQLEQEIQSYKWIVNSLNELVDRFDDKVYKLEDKVKELEVEALTIKTEALNSDRYASKVVQTLLSIMRDLEEDNEKAMAELLKALK